VLIPISKGNPFSGGVKYTAGGKIGDFRWKPPFILILLELRVKEVVVTTGATRRAKLQSK